MSVLLLELMFRDIKNWFQLHEITKQIPNRYLIYIYSSLCFNKIAEIDRVKYSELDTRDFICYYYRNAVQRKKLIGLTIITCTKTKDKNTITIIS